MKILILIWDVKGICRGVSCSDWLARVYPCIKLEERKMLQQIPVIYAYRETECIKVLGFLKNIYKDIEKPVFLDLLLQGWRPVNACAKWKKKKQKYVWKFPQPCV